MRLRSIDDAVEETALSAGPHPRNGRSALYLLEHNANLQRAGPLDAADLWGFECKRVLFGAFR
jgi:hypothetical protein